MDKFNGKNYDAALLNSALEEGRVLVLPVPIQTPIVELRITKTTESGAAALDYTVNAVLFELCHLPFWGTRYFSTVANALTYYYAQFPAGRE